MTCEVGLVEIDDVIACQLRGTMRRALRFAAGFPRADDLAALGSRDRGAVAYLVVEGGVVVGTCGTHRDPGTDGVAELGWGLVEAARGRGVGGAAVDRLLAALRSRYPGAALVAHTAWTRRDAGMAPCSPASEAILRRFGFDASPEPSSPGLRAWHGPVVVPQPVPSR